ERLGRSTVKHHSGKPGAAAIIPGTAPGSCSGARNEVGKQEGGMMQLYLIRHGEPDWQQLGAEAQDGRAGSLAPLTALGRLQMDAIAADYRLQEADAIISSSYTRCLESAARLSRQLNKQLFVEHARSEERRVGERERQRSDTTR